MKRLPALVILLATLASACGVTHTRELPRRNPTQWIYDADVASVAACAQSSLSEPVVTSWNEHAKLDKLETERLQEMPGRNNDLVIEADGWLDGVHSESYLRRSCPLPLYATWRLHLVALGSRTVVTVETEAHVHNYDCFYIGHPWGCAIAVDPTSIEEYRLLLALGECLHQPNMPSVVLPPGNKPDPAACEN